MAYREWKQKWMSYRNFLLIGAWTFPFFWFLFCRDVTQWCKHYSKLGDRAVKYPLLGALVKALLSLLHGTADVERGLSENSCMLRDRASLSISTVNGLRSIMSFSERFGRNAAAVPLSGELIRAVEGARKHQMEWLEGQALGEPREKKSKPSIPLLQARLAKSKNCRPNCRFS